MFSIFSTFEKESIVDNGNLIVYTHIKENERVITNCDYKMSVWLKIC